MKLAQTESTQIRLFTVFCAFSQIIEENFCQSLLQLPLQPVAFAVAVIASLDMGKQSLNALVHILHTLLNLIIAILDQSTFRIGMQNKANL